MRKHLMIFTVAIAAAVLMLGFAADCDRAHAWGRSSDTAGMTPGYGYGFGFHGMVPTYYGYQPFGIPNIWNRGAPGPGLFPGIGLPGTPGMRRGVGFGGYYGFPR